MPSSVGATRSRVFRASSDSRSCVRGLAVSCVRANSGRASIVSAVMAEPSSGFVWGTMEAIEATASSAEISSRSSSSASSDSRSPNVASPSRLKTTFTGSAVSYFSWSAAKASPRSFPSVRNEATSALNEIRNSAITASNVTRAVSPRICFGLVAINVPTRFIKCSFPVLPLLPHGRGVRPGHSSRPGRRSHG